MLMSGCAVRHLLALIYYRETEILSGFKSESSSSSNQGVAGCLYLCMWFIQIVEDFIFMPAGEKETAHWLTDVFEC